jgi:hypothetical protein
MEPDHIGEDSDTALDVQYCSVAEAVKLITHPFDGDTKRLREFIENVDVAFELVHPSKHGIMLKFVKTKITGDARSKLIVRDLTYLGIGKKDFRRELCRATQVRFLCMLDV